MNVLPKRFERFGLSLHPEKTKLLPFGKPMKNSRFKCDTFDFPGFTFHWSKSRRGYWVIRKRTVGKRRSRFMKSLRSWCKKNRHKPIVDQHKDMCMKLTGYCQYYGVRSNFKALDVVFGHAMMAWRFWLGRRNHKGLISGDKFDKMRRKFPLPRPRIVHNI
jgi:hypothetical protein